MSDTLTLPDHILAEFGQPEFWAVTVVDTLSEEVPHWRTLGYTSVLRLLENAVAGAGKDIHSGEWRVYELRGSDLESVVAAMPDAEGEDFTGVRVVVAVARGVS